MKIDYDKHRENYMEQLKEKINKNIAYHVERVAEKGSSSFSTCDYSGWDKDIWNYRHSIIDKLIDLGLNVESAVNHGVLDVTITANLEL
jgi:hypothetical protein